MRSVSTKDEPGPRVRDDAVDDRQVECGEEKRLEVNPMFLAWCAPGSEGEGCGAPQHSQTNGPISNNIRAS